MRIQGQPLLPTSLTATGMATASPGPEARASRGDALDVSSAARRVAEAQQRLAALPEVRMDKVVALQNQLDAGTYHPDPAAVADALIQDHWAPPRGA